MHSSCLELDTPSKIRCLPRSEQKSDTRPICASTRRKKRWLTRPAIVVIEHNPMLYMSSAVSYTMQSVLTVIKPIRALLQRQMITMTVVSCASIVGRPSHLPYVKEGNHTGSRETIFRRCDTRTCAEHVPQCRQRQPSKSRSRGLHTANLPACTTVA
jgi:hypothetical protein